MKLKFYTFFVCSRNASDWLKTRKFKVKRIEGDGHCLVYSLQESLERQERVSTTKSSLLNKCRVELTNHLQVYTSFYTGKNLLKEFDHHVKYNMYDLEVVDIMLQALSNVISAKIVVANCRKNGILEIPFPPRNMKDNRTVYIFRRGDHFDALVPDDSYSNPQTDEECWSEGEPGKVQAQHGNFKYRNIFVRKFGCLVALCLDIYIFV